MSDLPGPVDVAPHVHRWQPNGTVDVEKMHYSPVSAMDHQIETGTYSITVCECGVTRRVLVARKYRWANR